MDSSRLRPWILAAAVYSALTVALTWPLVLRISTTIPNDVGDPVLNMWLMWWNAHATPLTERWWNAPMFWPSRGVMALSETLLGLAPIASPIQWAGGNAMTAYNVVFLLTFPTAALGAHALAYSLTRRHDASFIAGLVYGFNPYRVPHFAQIQMLASGGMPLALAALHEYLRDGRRMWLYAFGASWLWQALSNGYYLLFFPVLLALWIVWFATTRETMKRLPPILAAFVLASLPLAPVLVKYRQIHELFDFRRNIGEIEAFSADVASIADASGRLRFWPISVFHVPEGELFPGVTVAILVLVAIAAWLWRSDRAGRRSRAAMVLMAVVAVSVAVALSPAFYGPWAITIGGRTLLSVRAVSKPLTFAVLATLAVFVLEPRFRDLRRRRSPMMFYLLGIGAIGLLALGPRPKIFGTPFMYYAPYRWLMHLPGFDEVRVPARFAMLAILCLSAAAALSFVRVSRGLGRTATATLALVVALGVVADGWLRELPFEAPPAVFDLLASRPSDNAILEISAEGPGEETFPMYRSMFHRHPLVNGYSGYFSPTFDIVRRAILEQDEAILDGVTAFGPVTVAIEAAADPDGWWTRTLAARPGTTRIGVAPGWVFFAVPKSALAGSTADSAGTRLPISSVAVNRFGAQAPLMTDGNPRTRWGSGPQDGSEIVTIDLGSPRQVDTVRMEVGHYVYDYPRVLRVETSTDGAEWTMRWTGPTAPRAFIAAAGAPATAPIAIPVGAEARFVRLEQTRATPTFYWSIAELAVFGR